MKLPESVKPIWRTVQVIRVSKGLDDGLRMFIVGPYFYEIFKRVSGSETALLYTSIVWAIYCGLVALLEIPTGVLADVFGRTNAIVSCFVFNLIYALGLASLVFFKHTYLVFSMVVFISIARAAAITLYNGSFSAWVVDSVREKHPDFGYERLLASGYVYYSCSMVVGAALGVTFYLYGVAYVAFVLGGMTCLNCIIYCLAQMQESRSLHFFSFKQFWGDAGSRMAEVVVTAFRVCHRVPALRWLILAFACYGFLFNVVGYLWPIALGSQYGTEKWSPNWYIMAFAVPATCALGSQILAWWGNRLHQKTGQKMSTQSLLRWMIGTCVFAALPIMALGAAQVFGRVPFFVFAWGVLSLQSTQGIVDPCYSALMHYYIPEQNSRERATIMSIGTMLNGFLMLLLLVPSSSPSGTSTTIGWILPAGILLIMAIVAKLKVGKCEGRDLSCLPITD